MNADLTSSPLIGQLPQPGDTQPCTRESWEEQLLRLLQFENKVTPCNHRDELKVPGCQSNTWVEPLFIDGRFSLYGDSDSRIVKSLLGVIAETWNGSTPAQMACGDIWDCLAGCGLTSMHRRRQTVFRDIIQRIKNSAQQKVHNGNA
jgi:sulfur transfer protein SufE